MLFTHNFATETVVGEWLITVSQITAQFFFLTLIPTSEENLQRKPVPKMHETS